MILKLNQISPNPSNPRLIRDEPFATLKRSIAQFPQMLQKRGIAVAKENKKWVALGGNQRYRALLDLKKEIAEPGFAERYDVGETETLLLKAYFAAGVPCVDCSDLSERQRKRFVIADNQPFGEWDFDALANGWEAEDLKDWGLEIPVWGEGGGADYSDKNKEIDVDGFDTKMEMKFHFSIEDFQRANSALLSLGSTIEEGLLILLDKNGA